MTSGEACHASSEQLWGGASEHLHRGWLKQGEQHMFTDINTTLGQTAPTLLGEPPGDGP